VSLVDVISENEPSGRRDSAFETRPAHAGKRIGSRSFRPISCKTTLKTITRYEAFMATSRIDNT